MLSSKEAKTLISFKINNKVKYVNKSTLFDINEASEGGYDYSL